MFKGVVKVVEQKIKSTWDKQKKNNKYSTDSKLLPFEKFEKDLKERSILAVKFKNEQKHLTDFNTKTATKKDKKQTQKSNEWISPINIIDQPIIIIPQKIRLVCDSIQEKFPSLEFSLMVKGKYTPEGFTLSEDYIVPKQKVSGGEVLYEELTQYQRDGYNCVIHSHHTMNIGFSVKDRNYINCQNPCSVLYNNKGFKMATLSFKVKNNIFLMETYQIKTVVTDYVSVSGIENIELQSSKKDKTEKHEPFTLDEPLTQFSYLNDDDNIQKCSDGIHLIFNGHKMTIENYYLNCDGCKCPYPEYCDRCLESLEVI